MNREEIAICKIYLDDLDKTRDCNEYKLLMDLLDKEPSEDCVGRAEVKKIAKEMYLEVANMDIDATTISDCIACTASKCREVLESKLQALPPVTPTQKWIPISEKPPKDKQPCFVTKIIPGGYKRIVNTATYSTNLYEVNKYEFADKKNIPGFYNYGSDGYFECTGVIAWMPKPEPYKAKIDSEFKKNCNKCMHYTDADEIQGITPCGSCGVEKKNFEQKTEIDDEE